jgi:FkbM family methyltransferase
MNDLTNTRLVAAAVSDRDDALPLFVGPSFLSLGRSTTVARAAQGHPLLREKEGVRAAPLGSLVTREELATARLIKIDVEGAEDRVLAGMLASVDALAADAELVVEVMPTWWSDPQQPIDVLRPFLERGFHVYLLPTTTRRGATCGPGMSARPSGSATSRCWGAAESATLCCHAPTPTRCEEGFDTLQSWPVPIIPTGASAAKIGQHASSGRNFHKISDGRNALGGLVIRVAISRARAT